MKKPLKRFINIERAAKNKYRISIVDHFGPFDNKSTTIELPGLGLKNIAIGCGMVLDTETPIGEGVTIYENGKSPNFK